MSKKIIITLEAGLHMWEIAEISRIANQFVCQIVIRKNRLVTNAKIFLELVALNGVKGSNLEVTSRGMDEDEAIMVIHHFAKGVFGCKTTVERIESGGLSPDPKDKDYPTPVMRRGLETANRKLVSLPFIS